MSNGFEALKPFVAEIKERSRKKEAEEEQKKKTAQRIARDTLDFMRVMEQTGVKTATGVKLSAKTADGDIDFSRAMGAAGVKPLSSPKRVHHYKKSAPEPRQTLADNQQVLADAMSDEADPSDFLESEDGLSWRRQGVGPDVPRDLRRGRWCVVGQLDLHGMIVEEARLAVGEFLKKCQSQERLCLRIIHGKGNGSPNHMAILRDKVRRWLKQRDEVIAFAEAREIDGGAGVTLVRLRPAKR